MLANTTNGNGMTSGVDKKQSPSEPLNKNQLMQALKYLINTDDDFAKKIHEAYLKSLIFNR